MERFRYKNGREMNPFFIYKALNDAERLICHKLVEEGGPLGMDEEEIAVAQMELEKVEALVECGIVKKATLFEMAKELVEDEKLGKRIERLGEEGGYFGTDDENERLFISSFDLACNIVQSGNIEGNSTIYYRVARRDLSDYLEMLL